MPRPKPLDALDWVRLACLVDPNAEGRRRALWGVRFDHNRMIATDGRRLHLATGSGEGTDAAATYLYGKDGSRELYNDDYVDWRHLFKMRAKRPDYVVRGQRIEDLVALTGGLAKASALLPKRTTMLGGDSMFLVTLESPKGRVHLNPALLYDVMRGAYRGDREIVYIWAPSSEHAAFFDLGFGREAVVMPVRGHQDFRADDGSWVTVDPSPDSPLHIPFDGMCEEYSATKHGKVEAAA